ncbi:hypothetical protein Vadar_018675 [Vaccinium darrowii]|uniref:Uncharacterized protein n=1 Tax=Vaccinium darrowii TaxID=229202 RepID=A0ACB7XZY4_9ERIC|nr:hypothetical protein Vadar_018675 [Vaccinium darrowii]
MSLISATIFIGILLSAAAEIRNTRWLWRRSKTSPFQWLLYFPLAKPEAAVAVVEAKLLVLGLVQVGLVKRIN